LVSERPRSAGPVEESKVTGDQRPLSGLAQIVDSTPDELSGMLRIVAGSQPDRAIVALLRADDLASQIDFVSCKQFQVAIVRADHIEQIGEPIVVIMADIWAKQPLSNRTGRIRLVKSVDQALENLLCKIG